MNTGIIYHIKEFRRRFISVLLCFLLTFCVSYYYSDILVSLILNLSNKSGISTLITLSLTSGFFIRMKIAFYLSFILTAPFAMFHLYLFVSLGLFKVERKKFLSLLIWCYSLFIIGVVSTYLAFVPIFMKFFATSNKFYGVVNFINLEHALDTIVSILIAFGLTFQTPVLIYYSIKLNIITIEKIVSFRKYYIVLYLVIGAVITPPDVVSQVCVAVLLLVLTEATLIFAKFKNVQRKH